MSHDPRYSKTLVSIQHQIASPCRSNRRTPRQLTNGNAESAELSRSTHHCRVCYAVGRISQLTFILTKNSESGKNGGLVDDT